MSEARARQWQEANQRHLIAAIAEVRTRVEIHASRGAERDPASDERLNATAREVARSREALNAPSALELVQRRLGLTPFERDILLLCAGVELDSACAAAVAKAQGDPRRTPVTFSLALAALPNPHWSALTPAGPLRRWRLLEVEPGPHLTSSALRIDERILHSLVGIHYLDERLQGLVQAMAPPDRLAPCHQAVAERLAGSWQDAPMACVLLTGGDPQASAGITATAAAMRDWRVFRLNACDIHQAAADRELLARLWEREAALGAAVLALDAEGVSTGEQRRAAHALVDSLHATVVVIQREPWDGWQRGVRRLEVPRPAAHERCALWRAALGPLAPGLEGHVERVAAHFCISGPEIEAVAGEVRTLAAREGSAGHGQHLWDECRRAARRRLDELAQRIESGAGWPDLVLPDPALAALREMAAQVRQRFLVYETWAFGPRLARGLGITALFAGASGTGKTLAAEVLANELHLDLYRIDLSAVVSKYIGETEKNLRRVFDAAEASGAVLLFDEADALFGRRSEVRDSHDRYANIEVSYLLQRMEGYHGLAILTTNLKNLLDPAFLRRLRFVVSFPFPDATQRAEIWRRVFPPQLPTDRVDPALLAQLNVPGGNIRNIALNAAFLAAEATEPVRMHHLLAAARTEYAKLERPLTEAEIAHWQ
jgi:hypothetical protein